LVTGGETGIGRAIALRALADGANVCCGSEAVIFSSMK
jgi:NAD(P)-dependent dehydrogenase (short-subunit alcohol dehydrogenase family)